MLVIGSSALAAHFRWFLATVLLTVGAIGWYIAEAVDSHIWPGGSSRVGLSLGVAGATIIAFEMLLWPRKRFPLARTLPLGRTKYWMMAHIWLGLLCVPLVILHTGFRLGSTLTTVLMATFSLVILSGIWGLILQQVLPRWLLDGVPDEVPAREIERVLQVHTEEFARNLAADRGEYGSPPVPGIAEVAELYETLAKPYLFGLRRSPELRVSRRAEALFERLKATSPAASERIRDLDELCGLRRQFDQQARMHWWLHNWIWVHLPLSVALVGLLVAHIYTALRYI